MMMKEYFVVAVEGIAYQFNSFEEAREEYEELKACGFHEATLRRVEEVNGDKYKVAWNDRCACFFPC
jgi:hypothetical protein